MTHIPSHATRPRGAAIERVRKRDEEQRARNEAEAERRRQERVSRGEISIATPEQDIIRKGFRAGGETRIVDGKPVRFPEPVTEREFRKLRGAVERPTEEIQQKQATQLEQAGVFEEVTPREQPLTSPLGTDIPIITPSIAALSQIAGERSLLGIARDKGFFPKLLPKLKEGVEEFPTPETPETLREAALREIRQLSFDEGVSNAEGFGTFVEAIPLVGSLARKFAGGLVETPSANADNVIDEINKLKEAASTGQEKVRNGLEDPDYGLDRARQMEAGLAELEGRLKLLISTSPILQANTDEVNKIQEQVLEAKEKVNRYRTASSFGLTAQLTGTGRIIPTDEQMFFELKRLKGGK